jgi:L-asparaginase
MKIVIMTTGGTIDKIYFDQKSEYQVGDPQILDLLTEANVTVDFEIRSIFKKDSLEMTDEDRKMIRETVTADPHRHILMTHGTDTMISTAKALKGIEDKVIVLTGSMQPARFRYTDAIFNIASAFTAIQLLPAGVYIAMHGRIFDPDHAVKNVEKTRFELCL